MTYKEKSAYLKRELNVTLLNNYNKQSVSFKNAKISVGGSKFIGIQQDNFTVQLHNVNYALVVDYLNKGFRNIVVSIDNPNSTNGETVFSGEIRVINIGKSSVIERQIEFVCLKRVSDLMANMVVPFTMHSSINGWAVWDAFVELQNTMSVNYGEKQTIIFDTELKNILKNIYVPGQAYSVHKSPIAIVEDIVGFANKFLPSNMNGRVNWIDFKLDNNDGGGGIINLFSSNNGGIKIMEISPSSGLLDAPTISDTEISFNHIYHEALVPGRVVKLDNSLISTMGGTTSFIWAFDPNGLYVITELRFSLNNYPSKFTMSVIARPQSKYQNFASSLDNYEGTN